MLEFIKCTKPSSVTEAEKEEGLAMESSNVGGRLERLKEACEGNPSLLTLVDKLESSCLKQ